MEYTKDLSIVISLYNEEESLHELVEWIEGVMQKEGYVYEIIMVDDGSKDGSWKIVKELSEKNPCIRGIRFRRNYGKSAALYHGFKAAEGRVVITMDADLQDSPEEIPQMYRMVVEEGYDIVSGWKKQRFDNKFTKNIPSKLYNATARWVTGIKLHDMNCGLKAYRNEVVKNIEVYGEMHRYIPIHWNYCGWKSEVGKAIWPTSRVGLGARTSSHRARSTLGATARNRTNIHILMVNLELEAR